jgi:TonB family protein
MGKTSPKVTNNAPKVAPQNVAMRETPKEISSDLTPHPAAKSLVKVSGTQDLENIGGPGDGPGTAIKTGWGILDGDPTSTLPEPKEPKDTKELKVAEPVEKATPQIIRKSEGVIRGNTIYQAKPEYPAIARTASVSGDVQVEIVIGEDGNVVSTKILSGQPLLQQAALSAARQWKFKPTLLNNTPVKVQGVLTFRFTL